MYQNVDDVCDRLHEINSSLARLEKTIGESSTVYLLYRVFIVWCIIALFFEYGERAVHSRLRYSIQYGVKTDKIGAEKKPHDCDLLAAPIGEKFCTYKVAVTTVRWAQSADGIPLTSTDDGKTWQSFTPYVGQVVPKYPTVEEVSIGWQKEEQDF